jgi:hypothetical protein
MATWHAPDTIEREFASAQLDELALAHNGRPWTAWKEAVLEWHLRALAVARSEAWIPGLANSRDPVVEKALGRFYGHHMGVAIRRLRADNVELRGKMLEMTACARFYASGVTDAGARANALLKALELPSARMAQAGSELGSWHRDNAAVHQVRIGHQPQDREGARPGRAAIE